MCGEQIAAHEVYLKLTARQMLLAIVLPLKIQRAGAALVVEECVTSEHTLPHVLISINL